MHEIITIQFGNQSNHIGTHFWNAQESYFTYHPAPPSSVNHDVLFRAGRGPDGTETFTPRTLIYDVRDAFGTLRRGGGSGAAGGLYEGVERTADDGRTEGEVWSSDTTLIERQHAIPQSTYHSHLDSGLPPPVLAPSDIRYWSDYTRLFYHPRSLKPLSPPQPVLSPSAPATTTASASAAVEPHRLLDGTFTAGASLFADLDARTGDDLIDTDLRPLVEECDTLQGLQVVAGADDGWGGFAAGFVERARDELGRMPMWVWGVMGGDVAGSREKRQRQLVNTARSLHDLSQHASLYVPISAIPRRMPPPPYLELDRSSPWHTAALQATAIESMTLPARLHGTEASSRTALGDVEDTVRHGGNENRKIARLELGVADPSTLTQPKGDGGVNGDTRLMNGAAEDEAEEHAAFDIDLFPSEDEVNMSRLRSARRRGHRRDKVLARVEALRGAWKSRDQVERDNLHARNHGGPVVQRYLSDVLFPVGDASYPRIFAAQQRQSRGLAVRAALSTSSAVTSYVTVLEDTVRGLVPADEREALCDGLRTIAAEYEEGWMSDSDDGDDTDGV